MGFETNVSRTEKSSAIPGGNAIQSAANKAANTNSTDNPGIQIPQINLPKGGGAIRGIDEKFTVNAINGTASFSIPFPVSEARGFAPSLGVSYNSGNGNGIFGLGWSLSLSSIRRKTDKQLPQYLDKIDSDTYVMSDAEDLVPEFKKDIDGNFIKDGEGNFIINEFNSGDDDFVIRRYRPRTEGLFARIERWTEKITGFIHWRVVSKENVTTVYGRALLSRIFNPDKPDHAFEWMIDFSYDDKGRCVLYEYKREDGIGIDAAKLHNRNRTNGNTSFTNTYLKKVYYGNVDPYNNHGDPVPTQWLFETILDYGEHSDNLPYTEVNTWNFRTDAFSEYRAGFEIRTCRLCKRVLLYHHFAELPGASAIVKSVDFKYGNNGNDGFTFLEEIISTGFTKHDDGTYTQKSLPPFSFRYQKHTWNREIKSVAPENLVHTPAGIDENTYQFVDLYSEGLAGILTEQGDGWFYKTNLGGGKFTPARLVAPKPSFTGLRNSLQLMELEGDGVKQVTQWQAEPKGFFELNDEGEWQPFTSFRQIPNINFRDPNVRMIDLNGDGRPDVLIADENVFTCYSSEGKTGYGAATKSSKTYDEEKGPALVFANGIQTFFLADMNGEGLTDLVRIQNGEVCYWPNLGYGRFGSKVSMDAAPVFDHPDAFNPALIKLADVDGSGTTDIIYLGKNEFSIWLNQHGNSFLPEPITIETFPEITSYTKVSVIDLLGNGMSCIVWSCDLPKHENQRLRYIDILDSKKPHVLTLYKNNFGKEVGLEYKPSTHYYIEDKLQGNPWITKLHFPVQCVSKVITYDRIMKTRFATEYSYHQGFYDHTEKEFRGFGRVDQQDAEDIVHFMKQENGTSVIEEDLHQPPVLTKSWFHTGAFLERGKILNQFSHEYFKNTLFAENILPEPVLPTDLTLDELRQALRACKGMLLRKEVYAMDTSSQSDNPYSVEQYTSVIKILQPKASNKFGVFFSHESESVTYQYERNPADPRIAHTFVLDIDDFGNVLQNASVVYSRQIPSPGDHASEPEQDEQHIVFTENKFTKDVQQLLDYRAPLPHFTKSYELTGLPAPAGYYSLQQIITACNTASFIDYEIAPPPAGLQKRIIEFVRHQYRGNDGLTVLPFGDIESKGLAHQSLRAAFNQQVLNTTFSVKIGLPALQALLTDPLKGAYIFSDNYFWIPSGTQNYDQDHFFISTQFTNALGKITTIEYDTNYFLFVKKITDALANEITVDGFNYRTLSPYIIRDMNDNVSAIRFDELGMVVKSFLVGKNGIDEGDEFDGSKVEMKNAVDFPSSEMQYSLLEWYTQTQMPGFDVNAYKPNPDFVKTRARTTHYHADPLHQTNWHESFSYSDGGGHEILKKVQAEPGAALQVSPDGTVIFIPDTSPALRWVGNARVILNNKGNAVKQYEPYYSVTPSFDDEKDMVELGVTPVLHYDPPGRLIRTDFPNGTFSRVEFNAWQQKSFDPNDTVADSKWYDERILNPVPAIATPDEISAAQKAFLHNNTPTIVYLDSLGRDFLTIADSGSEKLSSRTKLDIEGNMLQVGDPLGHTVITYNYGMLGNKLKQISPENGTRWMISDVVGKALITWDDRGHEFTFEYDDLGRAIQLVMKPDAGATVVFSKTEYGESLPVATAKNNNLRSRVYRQYDQSGIVINSSNDFKGNGLITSKQFAGDYKGIIDWATIPIVELNPEIFESVKNYDALNRPVKIITPHTAAMLYSEFYPIYNESNLLDKIDVRIRDGAVTNFITGITYNAKAQREEIFYGNDTKIKYTYEKTTFRLKQLFTTRSSAPAILQDLRYTYDPVGNITEISDHAQPDIFFDGENAQALNKYEYDALYRLVKATGRKHAGQSDINHNKSDFNYRNHPFIDSGSVDPNDAQAFRNYTEQYAYDKAGNMLEQKHIAKSSSWTRSFNYLNGNNQLTGTGVGAFNVNYAYDFHGNLLLMEHLQQMIWDFHDHLKEVNLGGGGHAYYVYDGSGQRVRKVIERLDGTRKERLYLGGIEIYREINASAVTELERETLHIMDDTRRIAMVDTPLIKPVGSGEMQLIRYNYDNHLGSSSLELDDTAQIISYEEYFPFGTTSYSTIDAVREVPAKRYRYTGKERDEESGLNYHGARYCAPWICRWVSADPIGIKGGLNVYAYVGNNPVMLHDPNGTQDKPYTVTTDDKGAPVYQSTGDQVGTDSGKVAKKGWEAAKESDELKNLKKLVLDPQLSYLKNTFSKEWEKDKVGPIIGGAAFVLPTVFLLTYLTVNDKKLDVPIVGEVHTREVGFGALSAGLGVLSSEVFKDKVKLDINYENKEGKERFGYSHSTPFITESLKLDVAGKFGTDYQKFSLGFTYNPRPDVKATISGSGESDSGKETVGGKFTLKAPIDKAPFEFGVTGAYKFDAEAGKAPLTGSLEATYAPKIYGTTLQFGVQGFVGATAPKEGPFLPKTELDIVKPGPLPQYTPLGSGVFFTLTIPTGSVGKKQKDK